MFNLGNINEMIDYLGDCFDHFLIEQYFYGLAEAFISKNWL